MEFEINAGKLLENIQSAVLVANEGAVEDFNEAFCLTLTADKKELLCNANGGRLQIGISISDDTISDSGYKFIVGGHVTVNASDLANSLSSFPPSTTLKAHLSGGEFVMMNKNDEEEFQSLAVHDFQIKKPKVMDSFDKEITINRGVFVGAVKKVFFAYGFEKERPRYLYWVSRFSKGKARFVAGDGMRFAVLDIEGKTFLNCSKKTDILLPNEQTKVVIKLIEKDTSDNLVIKANDDQVVFVVDSYELVLAGFERNVEYVDENKYLSCDKNYHISTEIGAWKFAVKGIRATFNEEARKQHTTHDAQMTVDVNNKLLHFTVNESNMKASRKVSIVNIKKQPENVEPLVFKCPSEYLSEIPKMADSDGQIDLEFIEDGKPIFVRHLPKENNTIGVVETFSVFFAPAKG